MNLSKRPKVNGVMIPGSVIPRPVINMIPVQAMRGYATCL